MAETFGMILDGRQVPALEGETFPVINPANIDEGVGLVPKGGREDVRRAVESALHLRHQFCEVRFLFRSDRFEGVTQVASYIRVPRHQVAAHLRAQVQQFADRHAGNLFGWQHRW